MNIVSSTDASMDPTIGLMILDQNAKVIYSNKKAERLMEISLGETLDIPIPASGLTELNSCDKKEKITLPITIYCESFDIQGDNISF